MNPSEFLDVLERLRARLKNGSTGTISKPAERKNLRSVVGAWFSVYRPSFIQIIGEEQHIPTMDERMQTLLKLASTESSRRTVVRLVGSAMEQFTDDLLFP